MSQLHVSDAWQAFMMASVQSVQRGRAAGTDGDLEHPLSRRCCCAGLKFLTKRL